MASNAHIQASKAASYERDRAFSEFWKLIKNALRATVSGPWQRKRNVQLSSTSRSARSVEVTF